MPNANRNTIPGEAGNPPRFHPVSTAEEGANLNGFERPYYFAGHLLTDADLTLEQRYFCDKTRLYQRALHGHGIVCGLRLTCDYGCRGGILVDRGYAIDDCGNDLILTEQIAFDVVARLKDKHLILDRTSAEYAESEGDLKQCFYITIQYQEEQTNFSTPLVATQERVAGACKPTRIRETIYPDAVERLPEQQRHPDNLKRRLESCYKLFSEGDFAWTLQKGGQQLLHDLVTDKTEPSEAHGKLFSDLRGYLLLYLSKNSNKDKYNRTIDEDIRNVSFPRPKNGEEKPSREQVADAFSSLLGLAWQHAVSCALGEFVPSCGEPATAAPVVLGTVVVENGRVTRVCNSPRSYIWSAANFPEGLLAMTLGDLAGSQRGDYDSESGDEEDDTRMVCCRQFNFSLEYFLQWLRVSPKAPFYSSTELVHWIESIGESVRKGFDFTNPCNFSARIFEGMNKDKATELLRAFEHSHRVIGPPLDTRAPQPMLAVLQKAGLSTGTSPIVLTVRDEVVTGAVSEPARLLTQINYLQKQLDGLKQRLKEMEAQKP